MPLNAATEAARLSTAPMMDGGYSRIISDSYWLVCAAHVHLKIVQQRRFSRSFRFVAFGT